MRRGFVLATVLCAIVALSAVALAALLATRQSLAAVHNRARLDRAMWIAEGCVSSARAVLDSALADVTRWSRLDSVVAGRDLGECDVFLGPAGAALDLNSATGEELTRLLDGVGVAAPERDSLVAALLVSRDEDDAPRRLDAERWYGAGDGFAPRGRPLADLRELRRVRGFDRLTGLDSVLTVEPGRVSLNHAALAVIAALPGMTADAVERLREVRLRGGRVSALQALPAMLSGAARESLLARFGEFVATATASPDAWILRVRAPAGAVARAFTIELRLVPAGNRAAVVRRREW